jgi:hypothetical protein
MELAASTYRVQIIKEESKTLEITYQSTCQHPEDQDLHQHYCKDFKPQKWKEYKNWGSSVGIVIRLQGGRSKKHGSILSRGKRMHI